MGLEVGTSAGYPGFRKFGRTRRPWFDHTPKTNGTPRNRGRPPGVGRKYPRGPLFFGKVVTFVAKVGKRDHPILCDFRVQASPTALEFADGNGEGALFLRGLLGAGAVRLAVTGTKVCANKARPQFQEEVGRRGVVRVGQPSFVKAESAD